jgi:hypothetical protein
MAYRSGPSAMTRTMRGPSQAPRRAPAPERRGRRQIDWCQEEVDGGGDHVGDAGRARPCAQYDVG